MGLKMDRPNGYFVTWDPISGRKVEGETRQCSHCGFMWVYDPFVAMARKLGMVEGKPVVRGKCFNCFGLVCGQPACLKMGCVPQMKQIEDAENEARNQGRILIT